MRQFSFSFVEKQKATYRLFHDESMRSLSLLPLGQFNQFVIFCDENIAKLWGNKIQSATKTYSKPLHWLIVSEGEASKDISCYVQHIKKLVSLKLKRSDLLIAIGGGVVQDLTSFIASTYMRGVPLLAIPTTLIAQVDAVTAGKTCINVMGHKNIIGTFYFPYISYINTSFLRSCSASDNRQGFSEIYKYGLLGSKKLIAYLQDYVCQSNKQKSLLEKIIFETIRVRTVIRKRDPLASNLGHTFGHAIEKLSDFTVRHGDAITLGTILALNFSIERNIIKSDVVREIIHNMHILQLVTKTRLRFDPKEMIDIMQQDKKSSSNLNLVLIRNIEEPYYGQTGFFYSVEPEIVYDFLVRKLDLIYA